MSRVRARRLRSEMPARLLSGLRSGLLVGLPVGLLAIGVAASALAAQRPLDNPSTALALDGAGPSPAAVAGDHFWVAVRVPGLGVAERLLHHHPSMLGAPLRDVSELSGTVRALAAWGDRVWVLFAPADDASLHEIVTVGAVANPILGTFDSEPRGRLELVPGLQVPGPLARGALVGFGADADGPVACVQDGASLHLLELVGTQWSRRTTLALPPGELVAIAAVGSDGRSIAMLLRTPDGAIDLLQRRVGRAVTASGRSGSTADAWTRWGIDGAGAARDGVRHALLRWDESALVVRVDESTVTLLRPTAAMAIPVATIARVVEDATPTPIPVDAATDGPVGELSGGASAWVVGALRSGIVLLATEPSATTARSAISVRRIDATTGRLGADLIAEAGPAGRTRFLHVPLLGGAIVLIVIAVLIHRGNALTRQVALPPSAIVADPVRRLAALGIDFAPAALVAWLVTGCDPIDLLILPIWTVPWSQALPSVLAIGGAVLHGALTEALFGTSLGKRAVGLRVIRVDDGGAALRGGRAVVRGVVRFVVLSLPLLAIFHVISAQWRGLPEQLVDGVVVGHRRGAA